MIVAQQLRNENIAKYLLYMWQVEDLIRAYHFDMDAIKMAVIDRYDQPEVVKQRIADWYAALVEAMCREGVREKGHIRQHRDVLDALSDLHRRLQHDAVQTAYSALYYRTLPCIVQLRAKSGGAEMPEIETCFTAVYGYLLLRMQRKDVAPDTQNAIRQIDALLNFLAAKFKEDAEQYIYDINNNE